MWIGAGYSRPWFGSSPVRRSFTSHNPLPWLIPSFLSHSPRSGREVEPNGERRRQGAEREEPNDRGAGWMTVKGAATRGLFVWPITVIPALSSGSSSHSSRRAEGTEPEPQAKGWE